MIIALSSQKGGVGKSTTCATLARWFYRRNPLVIDTDTQAALRNYAKNLKSRGCEVLEMPPSDVPAVLPVTRRKDSRLVLIDCPPSLSESAAAIEAADAVILPLQVQVPDVRGLLQSLEYFKENYPGKELGVLLTMYMASDPTQRELRDGLQAEFPDLLFRAVIPRSAHISAANAAGKTVFDTAPQSVAARQYSKFAKEVEAWLLDL